jgi:predicted RNA methylase
MLKPRDFNADRFPYDAMMPVFPLLAQQCLDDYQLDQGIFLDIGSGSGHLGTEIAKITNMTIYYIDIDPQAPKLEVLRYGASRDSLGVIPASGVRLVFMFLLLVPAFAFLWPAGLLRPCR